MLWPEQCSLAALSKTSHHQRAVCLVESLSVVGLKNILSADDILVGRGHRIFVLASMLFSKYCLAQSVGSFGERGLTALKKPDSSSDDNDDDGDKPMPPLELSFDRISRKYKEMRNTMRGWLYLLSKVTLCGYKQLQNGRSREGDITDLKERRRRCSYTFLEENKLSEVLSISINVNNAGDELDLCEDLLSLHYWDLRSIYQYYCCVDIGQRMSLDGFFIFLNECHVVKNLSKRLIDSCIDKSFKGQSEKIISPQHFVELLVRIGGEMATHRKVVYLSASEGLRRLIEEAILPRALRSDVEVFRYSSKQLAVQRVVKRYQKILRRAFRVYVSGISRGNDGGSITYEEFQRFIRECKLTDVNFTFADANQIYTNIICDETKILDVGMTFSEWVDAIICIAVHKHPTPLIPLHQRLDTFFDTLLLPKLKERIRQGMKQ